MSDKPSLSAFSLFLIICCLLGAVAGFAWSAWDAPEEKYEQRN